MRRWMISAVDNRFASGTVADLPEIDQDQFKLILKVNTLYDDQTG
jgi:hypothetical protein